MGSDSNEVVQLDFAHRPGHPDGRKIKSRDKDVLLRFLDWNIKALILEQLWDTPKIIVEGQELTFYSDLYPITIQRRKKWRFLTSKLVTGGIPYNGASRLNY